MYIFTYMLAARMIILFTGKSWSSLIARKSEERRFTRAKC